MAEDVKELIREITSSRSQFEAHVCDIHNLNGSHTIQLNCCELEANGWNENCPNEW